MKMTPKIQKALEAAEKLHCGQMRKVDGKPYVVHPYAVADILSDFTDDENIIAAGLLHDVLEDVEGYGYEDIRNDFGENIANIVKEVTEKKTSKDTEESKKDSWQSRKKLYIENIEFSSYEAKMVCAADKIHNLISMWEAYKKQGDLLWQKFNAPRDEVMWFYEEVIKVLKTKLDDAIVDVLIAAYLDTKENISKNEKYFCAPVGGEDFEDFVARIYFPLNPELRKNYSEKKDIIPDFSSLFIAFILDDFEPYKVYLVNPVYEKYDRVVMMTSAFFGMDDKIVSTSIVTKELGALGSKSFILVEEDDFDQLDYQIWYHLDLYRVDSSTTPDKMFEFYLPRYGTGYEESTRLLPTINANGMYISLSGASRTQKIEEEIKHMNTEGGDV